MATFSSQFRGKTNKQMPDTAGLRKAQKKELQLPQTLSEKMGNSFCADFSQVRYFENDSLSDLGARAMATGNEVHFARGEFNPATPHGEGLIGHELSHLVSQAHGEVAGPQGKSETLSQNHTLESRADWEAYRAVRGERIFNTPTVIQPMSLSEAPSMPMQGKTTAGANRKIAKYSAEMRDLGEREEFYQQYIDPSHQTTDRRGILTQEDMLEQLPSVLDPQDTRFLGKQNDPRAVMTGTLTPNQFLENNRQTSPRSRKFFSKDNNIPEANFDQPMGPNSSLSKILASKTLTSMQQQSPDKEVANSRMNFLKGYLTSLKSQMPSDLLKKDFYKTTDKQLNAQNNSIEETYARIQELEAREQLLQAHTENQYEPRKRDDLMMTSDIANQIGAWDRTLPKKEQHLPLYFGAMSHEQYLKSIGQNSEAAQKAYQQKYELDPFDMQNPMQQHAQVSKDARLNLFEELHQQGSTMQESSRNANFLQSYLQTYEKNLPRALLKKNFRKKYGG